MKDNISDDCIVYHLGLSKKDVKNVHYAILPGDPSRVEMIAKYIDINAYHISTSREYISFIAKIANQPILVCSTGIGGPSVSIAVEELAMIGIRKMIRIGTTGAIQEHIKMGDIIISNAAVRLDGASSHYAPMEYPSVADFKLTQSLINAAEKSNNKYHVGITVSSDTFYAGQERYNSFSGYVRKNFQGSVKEWQTLNVLNFEMEAATLFVMCSIFKLQAACICAVIANRTKSEIVDKTVYTQSMNDCIKIIINSIISNDQK